MEPKHLSPPSPFIPILVSSYFHHVCDKFPVLNSLSMKPPRASVFGVTPI